MKINVVFALIAFAIAALGGYGFYAANSADTGGLAISLTAGLLLFLTLGGALAIRPAGGQGTRLHISIVSVIFFAAFLIEQIIFSVLPFRVPPYVMVTGILLVVYILIVYAIGRALKDV